MPKVTSKTAAQFGLFTALSILIGSVVGIGIFFKNQEIFGFNNGRGTMILMSWIAGSIIALLMAWSFIEIMSSKEGSNSGYAGWAEKLIGNKFGSFLKVSHAVIYYAMLMPIFYYLAFDFMHALIYPNAESSVIGNSVAALFGPPILIYFNMKAQNASANIAKIISLVKLLPLLIVMFGGLFFTSNGGGFSGNLSSWDQMSEGKHLYTSTNNMEGFFMSLPSVIFDYGGFLVVANLARSIKKPEKNVPLTVIIGMCGIIAIYCLVTIAQIQQNGASVGDAVENFSGQVWLRKAVMVLVIISSLGVANAFSMVGPRTIQNALAENELPIRKGKKYTEDDFQTGGWMFMGISFIYTLGQLIWNWFSPKHDIITIMSDQPVLILFLMYGIMCLYGFINRFTNKVPVKKKMGFLITAPLAFISMMAIIGYKIIYLTIIKGSEDWGNQYEHILCFIVYIVIYITIPVGLMVWKNRRVKKGLQQNDPDPMMDTNLK